MSTARACAAVLRCGVRLRAAVAGGGGAPAVAALTPPAPGFRHFTTTCPRLFAAPAAAAAGGSAAAPAGAGTLSGNARAKLEKERRLRKRRAKTLQIRVRPGPTFHPDEALRLVKAMARSTFDESVELQVQLGIDPRKSTQGVRGVAQLPRGSGKAVSIAVFARGEKAEEARRAGATVVGAEDLVDAIAKGDVALNFTKMIATPDVMPLVGKVARILGPRGLMPNPKLGTVTVNVREAVAAARRGQAGFRAEKRGIVCAAFGKASFAAADLKENLRALCLALGDHKPEGLKGTYMRAAVLKSTMGRGIPVDVTRLDPTSATFLDVAPPSAAAVAAAAAAVAAGATVA